MRPRRLGVTQGLAIALAALSVSGSPAHAATVDEVQRGIIVTFTGQITAVNLVSGAVATTTFDVEPGGDVALGDVVPGEVEDALPPSLGALIGRKCSPGGYDLYTTITAKNVANQTLFKFHVDTEVWYDCKVVTSIPVLSVYGSDYDWLWRWDGLVTRTQSGAHTKVATIVGAGSFAQCLNYGFGETCVQHATEKITIHAFGSGGYTAVGR